MKDRTRITITLRPEILNLLDTKIDGIKIRNRSHAIEHFLKKTLTTSINQAIILINKEQHSLQEICGETVIEKTLKSLKKASIKNIIIYATTNITKLKKYLNKKKFQTFNFTFINNNKKTNPLTTCQQIINPETFIVINGDIVAEIDIYDLIDFHKTHKKTATMVINSVADPSPWGMVRVKRNKITEYYEKPKNKKNILRLTNLINAGIYIFEPDIFAYTKTTKKLEDTFKKLIKDKQLLAYLLDGVWFNISQEKMLTHAKKYCWIK